MKTPAMRNEPFWKVWEGASHYPREWQGDGDSHRHHPHLIDRAYWLRQISRKLEIPMKTAFTTAIALVLLISSVSQASAADSLDEAFANPAEDTKPWCYWYWLNGDISKEGITRDLEQMAEVGISKAMIGNVEVTGARPGKVKILSPAWHELTRHALREAGRVGVEIYMFNGPGWSQSGGPWIKPEQSMRRVIWTEETATGGGFSKKVRATAEHPVQDIAVLAVPRQDAPALTGVPARPAGEAPDLLASSWVWLAGENAASDAPAGTRFFRRVISLDPSSLASTRLAVTADNVHTVWVNGTRVLSGDEWKDQKRASILASLKPGNNIIAVAVENMERGAAGLIAAIELQPKEGQPKTLHTDGSWLASKDAAEGWQTAAEAPEGWSAAEVLGPANMAPWKLSLPKAGGSGLLAFTGSGEFTARSLSITPSIGKYSFAGTLFAISPDGTRTEILEIASQSANPRTDFLATGPETFSFPAVTASRFELVWQKADGAGKAVLGSRPLVAQVIEKQIGRMHPTPSPTWDSYIFPASVEPEDPALLIQPEKILNLTEHLQEDGTLKCQLPDGDWDILYFGMTSTGMGNTPAAPEATGLECDKMSREAIRFHFNSMFGNMLKDLTPQEKAVWTGVTADSYEVGAQNWTDGFDKEFAQRNGYDPIVFLPALTGRMIRSAGASDTFLWDLRRTVADLIAEKYVGGLREIAHENGMKVWLENYGHWGFPAEFLNYGGHSDEIGGEFWSTGNLGSIECRAASSAAHIYGKQSVYAEAFTSKLNLNHHPYLVKRRGEELFCEGINHFVLHVYAHQSQDGAPGSNPWFGTAFHRNTPWFREAREWTRYLQRIHHMLKLGEPVADVAVYIGDFAPQMTGPPNPVPEGYDYDYINSDVILNRLRWADGEWQIPAETDPDRVAARYRALAIPETGHMRPHVAARLKELREAGGAFIEAVPVPAADLTAHGVSPIVSGLSQPCRWKARRLEDGGHVFFLSNFKQAGTFEATLRETGMQPELFNPVTGEIGILAFHEAVEGGTRVRFHVNDPSDSFFVVFRRKAEVSSVVKAVTNGKDATPGALGLWLNRNNELIAESFTAGTYQLTMSDGSKRSVAFTAPSPAAPIPLRADAGSTPAGHKIHRANFATPSGHDDGQRVILDLGSPKVMVKATLNGQDLPTRWMPPFAWDVTSHLRPGSNELVAEVIPAGAAAAAPLKKPAQLKLLKWKAVVAE